MNFTHHSILSLIWLWAEILLMLIPWVIHRVVHKSRLPFPAKMLVDYIKVMKWGEYGEVNEGPPEFQGGDFGLFTDLTPTDNSLTYWFRC